MHPSSGRLCRSSCAKASRTFGTLRSSMKFERHEKQTLASELLQTVQVEGVIWWQGADVQMLSQSTTSQRRETLHLAFMLVVDVTQTARKCYLSLDWLSPHQECFKPSGVIRLSSRLSHSSMRWSCRFVLHEAGELVCDFASVQSMICTMIKMFSCFYSYSIILSL